VSIIGALFASLLAGTLPHRGKQDGTAPTNLSHALTRLRDGFVQPSTWEKDEAFGAVVGALVRRGLLAAGFLSVLATVLYVLFSVVLLDKVPTFDFPPPPAERVYVVLWDKLLAAGGGVVLLIMYRAGVRVTPARWVALAIVVLLSAASVYDDVQGGDVSFSPGYPTLYMLVAVSTLMLRPLQTLGMTILVSAVVYLGEVFWAPQEAAPVGLVPEQIPFLFIVIIVLTGISLLLYVTRYEQHLARVKAETLERRIAAYAHELEVHARALEQEKARTEEQAQRLVEAERLKDRFFANISHEFRTPLTLILGPTQDALDGTYGLLPSRLHSPLSLVHSNAERLLRLVNDLLDLSKLEAGAIRLRPRVQDVVAFLRSAVHAFADLARRQGITLAFEAQVATVEVSFDADALERVVYNLVSNALKFVPEGGSVRIKVGMEADADQEFVCIAVRDTGPGIPHGDLHRIFDRFYQVEEPDAYRHEGTGLGLALVRELVELHGGDVSVDSEVGFGSEFKIRLPAGHRAAEPRLSRPGMLEVVEPEPGDDARLADLSDAETAPEEAPLVLVVDNNADLRSYIRRHLQPSYRVAEAKDGLAAFEQIGVERPALVICDVMMPRMDGFAFCSRLRQHPDFADLPVVLLTARADEESRLEGLQAGADAYMPKPFSSSELLVRVENLIEIRRILRSQTEPSVVGPTPVDVPSVDQLFLDQMRHVVEAHLHDANFGVDWLADELALSTRQLQRKTKELMRLSAAGYIRMMRLKRADQLLRQRAGNVSEIAYMVGYRDAPYFSKLFKQTFGRAPSEVLDGSASKPFQAGRGQ
jgi:signal transduction histidine kinase/DNA-binding response OmpR family regulator